MSTARSEGVPPKPSTVQGDLHNLPAALQPLVPQRRWVGWRWEWRPDKNGGGSWTKPPVQPGAPASYASSANCATWGTYEQALKAVAAKQCDGIGVMMKDARIGAFDLDKCRNPVTGDIMPEAAAIVARAGSYAEITVSGTGLRVIGMAAGGKVHRKHKLSGGAAEVEIYRDCERFITIAANPLPQATEALADIDAMIDAVNEELGHREEEDGAPDDPGAATPEPGLELPEDLVKLIEEGPEDGADLSAKFHYAVARMGDLGWNAAAIEQRIAGHPIVPERYASRLAGEIRRCLGKRRNAALNEAVERLAKLDAGAYALARTAEAKRLGIGVGVLDKLVWRVQARAAQGKARNANRELIEKLNQHYALAIIGNKLAVMHFAKIPLDDGSYADGFELWDIGTFKTWCLPLPPVQTGAKEFVAAADYWLMSKERRAYRGIEFEPGEGNGRERFYNLWKGFAVEPKAGGSCEKFLAHLRDNVARGNEEHFRWIVGWWAAIFQKPNKKTGTALVVRGRKGTGKSKVGEVFGRLLGEHYLQIVNSRYITEISTPTSLRSWCCTPTRRSGPATRPASGCSTTW
jgi:hypothetical protein